jgi:hypothetical protein
MIILNVRGTNASGKTTLVRSLLQTPAPVGTFHTVPFGRGSHPAGPTIVLGSYASRDGGWAKTGGMDKVRTQDEAEMSVRLAAQHLREECRGGIVAFEGLLISGLFQRWMDLDLALSRAGHQYVWAFMDTPLEVCYARVRSRSGKPYDAPDAFSNIDSKHAAVRRVRDRVKEAGRRVLDVDYTRPEESLAECLAELRADQKAVA